MLKSSGFLHDKGWIIPYYTVDSVSLGCRLDVRFSIVHQTSILQYWNVPWRNLMRTEVKAAQIKDTD